MGKFKNIISEVKTQIERTELHLSTMSEMVGTSHYRQLNPMYTRTQNKLVELEGLLRQLKLLRKNKKNRKLEQKTELEKDIESLDYQIINSVRHLSTMEESIGVPYNEHCMQSLHHSYLSEKIEELKRVKVILEEKNRIVNYNKSVL